MSVSAVLYPRWPPLLKIEISSNVQNCTILSQNVPKFEMYKHNDELFKIYYRIFYELWTFDRLRDHKTFFFASLFWKGVKISHIWKLYRIFHSILIIFLLLNGLCLRWYVGGFPLSFTVFLAHLVKGNVSFCHHLTSVVWNL